MTARSPFCSISRARGATLVCAAGLPSLKSKESVRRRAALLVKLECPFLCQEGLRRDWFSILLRARKRKVLGADLFVGSVPRWAWTNFQYGAINDGLLVGPSPVEKYSFSPGLTALLDECLKHENS